MTAKKRFNLTKFDKDLLHYLSDGPSSRRELLAKTRVAESDLDKRVKQLVRKKYLVDDGLTIALGIDGYNKLKKLEAAAAKRAAKKIGVVKKTSLPVAATREPVAQKSAPKTKPVKRGEAPANAIDLAEILKKAGGRIKEQPQNGFIARSRRDAHQTRAPSKPVFEKEPWPPKRGVPKEACELCKGGFSLSVKGGNPKYGHCFCGAAYHKDCYEALMNGDKHCVRCGRKLELYLDKQSEEAVHSIRDVFD